MTTAKIQTKTMQAARTMYLARLDLGYSPQTAEQAVELKYGKAIARVVRDAA